MKKPFKRVLFGTGIVIILLVLISVGFMMKMKSEIKTMHSAETGLIVNNISAIQDGFSNLFLVKSGENYIAIDAGQNPTVIAQELKKLHIKPEKIIAVLLTHSDGDHVGALNLFTNAKVYLSKQEEPMVRGEKSRLLFIKNKIEAEAYTTLSDQQVLRIGNRNIKGVLTPGHTPGSMCFLIDDKYLFTGDALSLKEGKIDRFNEFFNMDTKQAIHSLDKIAHFPEVEYIFTAHHGVSSDYKYAVANSEILKAKTITK